MQVSVTGFGKTVAAELEEACRFFADILMDPRMVRNLQIDIERDKKSDVLGECVNEDDCRNPRWFTINIRGLKEDDDPVKTLAHEMIHVKQHAKNELKSGFSYPAKGGLQSTSKWMGEIWKPGRREDPYFDSPWEIEAYGREVGLYHKWVEKCNER